MSEYRHYFYVTFSSKEPISSGEICSFMASDKLQELSEKDKLKMAMFTIIREGLPVKTMSDYCVFFSDIQSSCFHSPLESARKLKGYGIPEIYMDKCFLGSKDFLCSFEKGEDGFLYTAKYKGFGLFKMNLKEEHRFICPLLFLIYLAMGNKKNKLFLLKLIAISRLAGRWLLKQQRLHSKKEITDFMLDKLFEEFFARIDPNYEGKPLEYEDAFYTEHQLCYGVVVMELSKFEYTVDDIKNAYFENSIGQTENTDD